MRWTLLLVLFTACEGPNPGLDGGADGGNDTVPSLALPSWGACPLGWQPVDIEGASVCTPPPRVDCAGATFQPIGEAGCVPLDDACGAGTFRQERGEDRAYVFVDASAAGGDGTESRPFSTIDDALRAGATGILLAAGDYQITSALLPADLDVRGVCPDRTNLVAPAGGLSLLVAPGSRVALTGLSVTGTGLGLAARGTISLDRVAIEPGLEGFGVSLQGGTLEARRVVIRAPVPSARLAASSGIYAEASSTITIEDVVIDGAQGAGIFLAASSVTGERLVVQHIDAQPDGLLGGGISAAAGASVRLSDVYVHDVHDHGITTDTGAGFELTRVVIEDVASAPGESNGRGLQVWAGVGVARFVLIRRSTAAGVAERPEGTLTIDDLVVTDVRPYEAFGIGAAVDLGTLEVTRGLVVRSTFLGAACRGGTFRATDLTISDVVEAGTAGGGLACSDGGVCELTRFALRDLVTYGAIAVGDGSRLILSEGTIAGVASGTTHDIGRGIEVHSGGGGTVRDVTIEGVVETAILAFALDSSGVLHETSLELTNVRVTGIAERSCVSSTCPLEGGGTGVASLAGASIRATGLEVARAPLCGVQVFDGANLDLSGGTLSENSIGACVQIEGYELARIVGTTRFVENDRNVETVGTYVPPRGPTF